VRRALVRQLLGRNGAAAARDGHAAHALRRRALGRRAEDGAREPRTQGRAGRAMKGEEILINSTPREVRAALVASGVLQEVQIERASRRGVISNIYKGKVSRVLPGMQAAFIELGLERTAFLHASDIARSPHVEQPDDAGEPDIREFVREGQELLVQVLKEPL